MQLDKFFDFLKDEKNLYSQWEQSNCIKPKKGGTLFYNDATT